MKRFGIFLSVLLLLLVCSASGYYGIAMYYQNAYSYGTWINGIYCTGKTPEQVDELLKKDEGAEPVTIIDADGNEETISLDDVDYQVDYLKELTQIKKEQNPYLWGYNLTASDSIIVYGDIIYDKSKLIALVDNLNCVKVNNARAAKKSTIKRVKEGYLLEDNTQDILNEDSLIAAVETAIKEQGVEVDLTDQGCYEDKLPDYETKEVFTLWSKVEEFQNFHMTYEFGDDTEMIDSSVLSDWISVDGNGDFLFDENGNLILNEDKVVGYVAGLAEKYDTVGGVRQFQSTRGDMVTVEGGTYGNELNQTAEVAFLLDAFTKGESGFRTPEYIQKALYQGTNDIGDTYIEIDMTNQMLYYYIKGELFIKTPVVTGNTSLKRGTPVGTNYVYTKQKGRTLRGPNYASFVNYWVPVKGHIGIHDASWRSEYGGEIYKTNGSHGCINTPKEAMVQIYDKVEIGTPVVMFY